MRFFDEYRSREAVEKITALIARAASGKKAMTFMEVCGTHTMAIYRNGLKKLLPDNIRLLSGPGCPVCVTPNSFLDKAIALSRAEDVVLATFGDMMRVPGSSSTLEKERADGGTIKVVYSVTDALNIARSHPDKKVVFLGVGFETTAPTVAAAVVEAKKKSVRNFLVLCAHKVIPPAMSALVSTGDLDLDGFICPGHVSTIIGSRPYGPIARDHHIPCVVAGFEPLDIMQAILMLVRQVEEGASRVEIQYRRVVKEEGNKKAQGMMDEAFEACDSEWRGVGGIPLSGLRIRDTFKEHDAEEQFAISSEPTKEHAACICGEILRGVKEPEDCPLFRSECTPTTPVGACMVSSEGTCAAHYKYADA